MPEPYSDFDWEDLLLLIEDGRVVPIIGRELLRLPAAGGGEILLDRFVAERLAAELDVDEAALPAEYRLGDVAAEYLRRGKPRRKIYSRIKSIVDQEELPVPDALRRLAEIDDFNLYVTTGFDSLLERALNEARGKPARSLAFSAHRKADDLPCEAGHLPAPHVYHLLGPLTPSADYAVTEEDTLEFLHLLQSETHRPKILFDELRDNHLLFLGIGFPDWLARFFLRTVANDRLLKRETSEVIADSQVRTDSGLALFLKDCRAEIYATEDVAEFVNRLHEQWSERRPTRKDDGGGRPMPAGSVFVSYAHEDGDAANRLKTALESAGLEVWLDTRELESGDEWNLKIRRNIHRCSLFLPLISTTARRRDEGYFRREWRWAIDRAQGMAETRRFIQPILVDDIPERAEEIPEYFWTRQAVRLPGGDPTPEFVEQLKGQVRELRLKEAGLA